MNSRLIESQRPLLAGMNWNNGTNCSSQGQNANNYRWNTNTNIGGRALSDLGRILNGLNNPANISEIQNRSCRVASRRAETHPAQN